MSARSKARKRALDLIFAAEARQQVATDLLNEQVMAGDVPSNEYTVTLVKGVAEHAGRLDELITEYSRDWTLERMPAVDRNVLRLAIFEVLYVEDVPDAVAISEALNLVRDLSTDESPSFVNGVLGQISRDKARLTA
ncbi:transcription antitermination factor NusB [Marmoricola sp. RAF53]|uniref:transcription antitermination factor NusB n=1 Tax=Marmoricola sp. RAF53 TaxID=3233059 RepID=UPI003F9D24D0